MATTLRSLQAFAALVLLLARLVSASAQRQPSPASPPLPPGVARPGCRDRCGNITVPYPFGIGAGCYRDDGTAGGFQLLCDDARSPPRLTTDRYQLASLSLAAGEARIYLNATRKCYNTTTGEFVGRNDDASMALGEASPYRVSPTKTRLVATGCPTIGYFVDGDGYFVSGCTSVCRPAQYAIAGQGSCTGVGCCQSAIPPGLYYYEPNTLSLQGGQLDPIFDRNVTTCQYVFLADADWFSYSDRVFFNRTDDFAAPVVFDWAVRNVGNCSAAQRNMADYACRSGNSECVPSTNGAGYRCICKQGYEGNPYLDGGCRDIDECRRKDKYPCYGDCTNLPGNYTCKCRPGTDGDAYKQNGCRPKDKFTLALKVVTGFGVGVVLLLLCVCLNLGLEKRKLIRTKQRFFEQNGGVILQQQMRSYTSAGAGAGGFKIFSEDELENATNSFAADRVLGHGGHGIVYKGVLEDKTVVAIKRSKMMEEAQTKEFAREMLILSQINHRNVVKLLGCCLEVEVPMLVYEFVSNGTLYHYIHDKDLKADITLDTRLRIAAESAEALAYMHSSASPPILHGDVKTANILLDDKLTAKVSDFGASKLAPADEAEIATLVQGTCGYLDPEYLMTCQLTDKSDVYSFGVVLLELLTRKKALYFDGPEEDRSLVSCFMTAMKAGRHEELLDSQVRNEMRAEVLEEIAHLLMRCLSMSGEERPTMKEAAERLERLRRYQQHPWAQADGNLEERQTLLPMEQRDLPSMFRQQDVLDLEEGSTYNTYSL
ncbi:unnamed protein product [Miscanthus lutarioriparius]|uniref:Protein kinase domain-containing protein n=1 Tax=Miscanthus lutarioriparius TaxID=422564 RepID=A0A811PH35_9POAL|nr:unnamed protein product [Miscanthus lutarioriparius]